MSVVLPVFNGERYVAKTIDSILAQSYANFEFLILDDGSYDCTPAILAAYAQRDPRIRLLRHENRGVGLTLNRALTEARGRFIGLIGADDIATPDRFAKQIQYLEEHPQCVLVGSYLRIIDADDRPIGLRKYPTTDREIRKRMLLYNPVGGPCMAYRRDDAIAAGGYTSRFWTCEDYDFFLRLAKRGKIANLPEPLVSYRLHQGATKATSTLRQLRDTLATKRAAYHEYGYRQSLSARAVGVAQQAMTYAPPRMIYWLFAKLAVGREHE
ncbi:MAG: glycosyltransferase [Candidatus Eremiobacteraeota bacterium]|nr:glycosyltransferase [Candidatus Eremiobacteraeota bacterium]